MPTETAPRCMRCATLLRNARVICPSCGMSVGDTSEVVQAESQAAQPKRRTMKICPVCSKSVLVGELVEFQGQEICASCSEGLRAKALRRQSAENN